MQYSLQTVLDDSVQSIAIPLRILEVFTTPEETGRVIYIDVDPDSHLKDIFAYLVRNKYFEQVKQLIDAKVPSNLDPSPMPPTPMAKYFLEMIQRPLSIVNRMDNVNEFCFLVLHEFCKSILSQKLTDQISAFIIPALLEFKEFPYDKLITCINRYDSQPTVSLLYSVLQLEPPGYCKFIFTNSKILFSSFFKNTANSMKCILKFAAPGKSKSSLINYLQVLASLSSTINPPPSHQKLSNEQMDASDSDSDTEMLESGEADAIRRCIEMLNEEHRVQGILMAVDQSEEPIVMQPLCQLCHNLLITNKNAIHKYKLLYMLAFKPAFLRQLWSNLLTVSQTSLFGGSTPYLHIISRGIALSTEDTSRIVPLLAVFCSLFSLLIATLHDTEFFIEPSGLELALTNSNVDRGQQAMPFTTYDLAILSSHLKGVCLGLVELAFPDTRPSVRDDYKNAVLGPSSSISSTPQNTQMWTHLFKV